MGEKIQVSDEQIIEAASVSITASSAAATLGIRYTTYKKHATRLGVFKTNPAGKGISKPITDERKIPIDKILNGEHPEYQTNKLRKRLIKEGIKEDKCESCGVSEWQGQKLNLELDHIDGNKYNHVLSNLRIICPNCHSLTSTFRGRNTKKTKPS